MSQACTELTVNTKPDGSNNPDLKRCFRISRHYHEASSLTDTPHGEHPPIWTSAPLPISTSIFLRFQKLRFELRDIALYDCADRAVVRASGF